MEVTWRDRPAEEFEEPTTMNCQRCHRSVGLKAHYADEDEMSDDLFLAGWFDNEGWGWICGWCESDLREEEEQKKMHSKFGWSLPPGCGQTPGEEYEAPCVICGRDPSGGQSVGGCNCAECQCGDIGNPQCYVEHGLGPWSKSRELIGDGLCSRCDRVAVLMIAPKTIAGWVRFCEFHVNG